MSSGSWGWLGVWWWGGGLSLSLLTKGWVALHKGHSKGTGAVLTATASWEWSCRGENGVVGFAEGRMTWLGLQRGEWRGWVCRGENGVAGFAEERMVWLGLQRGEQHGWVCRGSPAASKVIYSC